jgi:hypothetical protein
MGKLDKLMKLVQEAKDKDIKRPPVRLATKYTHYSVRATKAEREMQRINRINRNAPVIRYKIPESE